MAQPASRTHFSHRIMQGIYEGTKIMLIQTPAVTLLNRASVVSCHGGVGMLPAITQIYSGSVDRVPTPSVRHFYRGITGHLVKEATRITFKATGIVLKPSIDASFKDKPSGAIKSDLIFAGSLSAAEMVINPVDTLRTMWQAGMKVCEIPSGRVISHLYAGAVSNGARQFGIWWGFSFSERVWSSVIDRHTSLDSHSIAGITVKSLPQSFQLTAPVWVFERIKNELQYHPKLCKNSKNRYARAVRHIRSSQGWKGFIRGFMPKVWSNYILVIGANYLLELGRSARKDGLVA